MSYIYIYIYDISSLRVNQIALSTFILLTSPFIHPHKQKCNKELSVEFVDLDNLSLYTRTYELFSLQ